MIDDHFTEREVNTIGGINKQIGTQRRKQVLKNGEGNQQHTEHRQGAHAVLTDNLINDLLNQQRIHQLEQLYKQRGDQHLNQRLTVLFDGWQEPLQPETGFRCGG